MMPFRAQLFGLGERRRGKKKVVAFVGRESNPGYFLIRVIVFIVFIVLPKLGKKYATTTQPTMTSTCLATPNFRLTSTSSCQSTASDVAAPGILSK